MVFRVARHTTDLESIIYFYRDLLGLEVLGSFQNHSTYDGVFLGIKGENWHLEFTVSTEEPVHKSDADDLLVFYPTTLERYNNIIQQLLENNIAEVEPKNPYWKINGRTFVDPDGFRMVLSNLKVS